MSSTKNKTKRSSVRGSTRKRRTIYNEIILRDKNGIVYTFIYNDYGTPIFTLQQETQIKSVEKSPQIQDKLEKLSNIGIVDIHFLKDLAEPQQGARSFVTSVEELKNTPIVHKMETRINHLEFLNRIRKSAPLHSYQFYYTAKPVIINKTKMQLLLLQDIQGVFSVFNLKTNEKVIPHSIELLITSGTQRPIFVSNASTPNTTTNDVLNVLNNYSNNYNYIISRTLTYSTFYDEFSNYKIPPPNIKDTYIYQIQTETGIIEYEFNIVSIGSFVADNTLPLGRVEKSP